MRLKQIRPVLWVEDVKATVDWYVNILGFQYNGDPDNTEWAFVTLDNVTIMFARPGASFPYKEMYFSGSFYVETDNAGSWWDKLKDNTTVFYPIEDFEYGMREFAIKDCNGYIIQFGQETDK